MVISDFSVTTTNFNKIIDQVNKKYGVSFKKVTDLEQTQEQLLTYLKSPEFQAGKKIKRRGKIGWMPVSSLAPEEIKKKEALRSIILQHSQIGYAQSVYQDMVS